MLALARRGISSSALATTLRTIDAQPGQALYLPDDQRVEIW